VLATVIALVCLAVLGTGLAYEYLRVWRVAEVGVGDRVPVRPLLEQPYQLAYLGGQTVRALQLALSSLRATGEIEVRGKRIARTGAVQDRSDRGGLEVAVLGAGSRTTWRRLLADRGVREAAADLRAELVEQGLFIGREQARHILRLGIGARSAISLGLIVLLSWLGHSSLGVGLLLGVPWFVLLQLRRFTRSVGWLLAGAMYVDTLLIVAWVRAAAGGGLLGTGAALGVLLLAYAQNWCFASDPRLTALGRRLLEETRTSGAVVSAPTGPGSFALKVALFGLAPIRAKDTELAKAIEVKRPMSLHLTVGS
jgi:uncharacterized protein (TIGR04222 family)